VICKAIHFNNDVSPVFHVRFVLLIILILCVVFSILFVFVLCLVHTNYLCLFIVHSWFLRLSLTFTYRIDAIGLRLVELLMFSITFSTSSIISWLLDIKG